MKVAKDDAKVDKSDLLGEPKRGLEFFKGNLFHGKKRSGESGEVVSLSFFFLKKNDLYFWDDVTGFALNVFDQTGLEDPCLRQIHNPSKHQPGIQTLMVGFDYQDILNTKPSCHSLATGHSRPLQEAT